MQAYLESILEADFGSDSVRVLSWEVEAADAGGLVLWLPALRLNRKRMTTEQDERIIKTTCNLYSHLAGGTGGMASGCIGFELVVFLH